MGPPFFITYINDRPAGVKYGIKQPYLFADELVLSVTDGNSDLAIQLATLDSVSSFVLTGVFQIASV